MLEAVDDELLDVELLLLSSTPRLGLLETILVAAAVELEDDSDTPLLSVKSVLLVLLVPFTGVGVEVGVDTVLSAAAAKAAVC